MSLGLATYPQAPARHPPAVESRFRGGAQRLGMRTAPTNSRGGVITWPSAADGARCRAKPQPTSRSSSDRTGCFLPVELGRVAKEGCAPLFRECQG